MSNLLGDVPQEAGSVETKKTVVDGDLVERGAFLVAEESVGYPDLIPASLAEAHLHDLAVDRHESEARITPFLSNVHTDRVVLCTRRQTRVSSRAGQVKRVYVHS